MFNFNTALEVATNDLVVKQREALEEQVLAVVYEKNLGWKYSTRFVQEYLGKKLSSGDARVFERTMLEREDMTDAELDEAYDSFHALQDAYIAI